MSIILVSPPTRVPAVDQQLFFTREWRNYLLSLQNATSAASQTLLELGLTAKTVSISTTPLTLPAVSAGFYRVNLYQTVTTADPLNSSLETIIGWTDLGNAKTFTTGAMAGNTTATNFSTTRMIHIDNASPITYATIYASNTPAAMVYALGLVVEKL